MKKHDCWRFTANRKSFPKQKMCRLMQDCGKRSPLKRNDASFSIILGGKFDLYFSEFCHEGTSVPQRSHTKLTQVSLLTES